MKWVFEGTAKVGLLGKGVYIQNGNVAYALERGRYKATPGGAIESQPAEGNGVQELLDLLAGREFAYFKLNIYDGRVDALEEVPDPNRIDEVKDFAPVEGE